MTTRVHSWILSMGGQRQFIQVLSWELWLPRPCWHRLPSWVGSLLHQVCCLMRTDTGCFPDKAQGIHSGLGNNSQVIRNLGVKLEISGHKQSLSPTTGLCTSTRETQRRLQGQYFQVSGPHPHRQSYLINTHTYSYVKVCSRTMQTHTYT